MITKFEKFKHLVFWGIWTVILCIGLVVWWKYTQAYTTISSDITQDWVAGRAILINQSIYGHSIKNLATTLLGFTGIDNFHPPSAVLILFPLSLVEYSTAVFVVNGLNLVFLYLLLALISEDLPRLRPYIFHIFPLLLLWNPFITSLGVVQISLPIIFLCLASRRLAKSGHEILGGLCLATAALLKLYPAFLLIYFILVKSYRAILSCLIAVGVASTATFYIVGAEDIHFFFASQIQHSSRLFAAFPPNGSIFSLVASLYSINQWTSPLIVLTWHQELSLALAIAIAIISVAAASRYNPKLQIDAAPPFALLCTTMLLITPVTWSHALPIMLLPLGLLFDSKLKSHRPLALAAMILFCIPDIAIANFFYNAFYPHVPWWFILPCKPVFWGIFIIWILLVHECFVGSANLTIHPPIDLMRYLRIVSLQGCKILFLLMLGLILAEILVRIVLDPPREVRYLKVPGSELNVEWYQAPDGIYTSTAQGRRLRPNLRALIKRHWLNDSDVLIETNSLGFRGPELEHPKSRYRILFVGDSITAADYLSYDNTFVAACERRLRAKGFDIETVNAGVGSIGSESYFHIVQESILQVDPDLLVIGLYLNDYRETPSMNLIYPPYFLQSSRLVQHFFNTLSLLRADRIARNGNSNRSELEARWATEIRSRFTAQSIELESGLPAQVLTAIPDWGGAWSEEAWTQIELELSKIAGIAQANDVELLALLFPAKAQMIISSDSERLFPQQKFAEMVSRLNIRNSIDVIKELEDRSIDDRAHLLLDQCHYSRMGNDIVAEIISEKLVHILSIPKSRSDH